MPKDKIEQYCVQQETCCIIGGLAVSQPKIAASNTKCVHILPLLE